MGHIKLFVRAGLLAGLGTVLIACASLPPSTDFLLNMRVGYRDANQAGSASLRWRQLGENYDARLIGGGELVQLRRRAHNYTLSLSGGPFRPMQDTSDVITEDIPLQYLEHWINLRPAPDTPAMVQRDAAGRTRSINQDGWHIRYLRWYQGFPRLIRAEKPPYQITLAILQRQVYE